MWVVLLLCFVASIADVIGGAFTVVKRLTSNQMFVITGLGTGFLLGATLLDRLPDSMQELPNTAPEYIVVAYLGLLLFERFGGRAHPHDMGHPENLDSHEVSFISSKSAWASFLGLILHTFMDGVIIAGSFSISKSAGVLMFVAITMHKIPEGFSMATISLAAGQSRRRAFLTSAALALSTMVGASITLSLGTSDVQLVRILMALATGTFLFISTSTLVPAVRKGDHKSVISLVVGVVVFYISLVLIKHVGLS